MQATIEAWFLLLSIPFYGVLIGAEILLSNWQDKGFYSWQETLKNVYLTVVNASLDMALRGVFYVSVLAWTYSHAFGQIENVYLYWFLLFILEDLAIYIEHSVDHYSRIFWAVHVTHHSSEEFNLTTGFRSSAFQPVYRFIYFIPLTLLGFQPIDIILMYSLTQTYGILLHTQYIDRMPKWFEAVFVSPSHHRVHHASNLLYLDRNMGMCLIIWDKLFGTFQEELPEEPVKFGLTSPLKNANNPIHLIFHEWKDIWKDVTQKGLPLSIRLKYLFMPPGWSHDGRSKTATALRKELVLSPKRKLSEIEKLDVLS